MRKSSLLLVLCTNFILAEQAQADASAHALDSMQPKLNSRRTGNSSNDIKPLMSLANSDMTIHINVPPPSDLQTTDKDIFYDDNRGTKFKIKLDHYNKKTFLLAYSVFVMNNKVGYAFKIADAAVKHNPKSIKWRKKLAEVALWAGNAEVALDQWMYFINNDIDAEDYIDKALKLAKQLYNYDDQVTIIRYMLQKYPDNKLLQLTYNEAIQNQGFPLKALKILQNNPDADLDFNYLQQLVAIAKGIDNPTLQLHYLRKLNKLKKDIKSRIAQAELLYSQGKFNDAYLIEHEIEAQVKPDDVEFWDSYGSVALLSGNYHSGIKAYRRLLDAKKITKSPLLELINLEQLDGQKEAAYRDAKAGYQQFKDIRIAKIILGLGTELGKWHDVKRFIDSLSLASLKMIQSEPDHAMLIPITNRRVGLAARAYEEWNAILQRWPNTPRVLKTYLWYLIDNNDVDQLQYVADRWRTIFDSKKQLWDVYAAVLSSVGENTRALSILEQHYDQIKNNYSMLLSLSDLVAAKDNVASDNSAYYIKRRALYLLLNEIGSHPEKMSLTQTISMAELARAFAPAAVTYNILADLSKKLFTRPDIDEEVIAWSLEEQNYELASYIIKIHDIAKLYTKPWMQLTLALEENNRDLMQFLLFDSPKLLPYRDKVRAAVRTGNIPLAEEYAYTGLEEHPENAEMYELFTDIMLPRSNRVSAEAAQRSIGDISGPLTKLSGLFYATPSISILPFVESWFPRSSNTAIITNTPSVDETTGIAARQYIERGWRELTVSQRKSLGNTIPVSLRWHRDNTIVTNLSADFSLGYNIKADETTPLLLGGMKNEFKLGLGYRVDSYNLIDTQFGVQQFAGQDNFYLGTGQEFRAHWQHKFYLSDPDWNINFYGSWLNYQDNNNRLLSPFLQTLVPAGQDGFVSFYMPINNIDGTVTLGFGQQYKEKYTYRWRPFAEAGVTYSKAFGWGPVVQGGLATSIWGRDRLVLFAEYTVNQQQVTPQAVNQQLDSQVYYIIGMKYDYFF